MTPMNQDMFRVASYIFRAHYKGKHVWDSDADKSAFLLMLELMKVKDNG